MYISIYTTCSSTSECIIKVLARMDGGKPEKLSPLLLMPRRPIGKTGAPSTADGARAPELIALGAGTPKSAAVERLVLEHQPGLLSSSPGAPSTFLFPLVLPGGSCPLPRPSLDALVPRGLLRPSRSQPPRSPLAVPPSLAVACWAPRNSATPFATLPSLQLPPQSAHSRRGVSSSLPIPSPSPDPSRFFRTSQLPTPSSTPSSSPPCLPVAIEDSSAPFAVPQASSVPHCRPRPPS